MRSAKVFVTDAWKQELLEVLCWDYYFTCKQASAIVNTFTYGRDKVKAATMVFQRLCYLLDEVQTSGLWKNR